MESLPLPLPRCHPKTNKVYFNPLPPKTQLTDLLLNCFSFTQNHETKRVEALGREKEKAERKQREGFLAKGGA